MKQKNTDLNRLKVEQDKADKAIKNLSRKSDINKKEIEQFVRELEAERRQTSTNQEGLNRKIKSMDEEKKKLEERIRSENERVNNYEAMMRRIG